jgi:hypothetical protein
MTDQTLLIFGAGISFIVLAGAYVFFRERHESGPKQAPRRVPVERTPQRPLRGATSGT